MEGFNIEKNETHESDEDRAEQELDQLLEDPEWDFLTLPINQSRIDNAKTAVEAVTIAKDLIQERLRRGFQFETVSDVEGVEVVDVDVVTIKSVIDRIKREQIEIGRGGDGYVVVSENEIKDYPPIICYKFAIEEQTPRGRNPLQVEAQIQGEFYDFVQTLENTRVGVPMPLYATEIGSDKVFAMEKLNAKSVDDILRGLGSLPAWFDVDDFCDDLAHFLKETHAKGLYHRDMHIGNVMISQLPKEPEGEPWGYVIDFGLSGHGVDGLDPYVKEVAGETYKYSRDEAIVSEIRNRLSDYVRRNS